MMILLFQTHAWDKPKVKKDGLVLEGDVLGPNSLKKPSINPPSLPYP